jgi:pyridoxal phosphate enzyme (YggS family)
MSTQKLNELKQQWSEVLGEISAAASRSGRDPSSIKLIAVSKTHPFEKLEVLHQLGQLHFGENRVQELVPKMEQGSDDIVWHMIGTLQSNKVKYMAQRVDWIHSVPKLKALEEINKRAGDAGRIINTLIQVNISEEDQKSGCDPDELKSLLLASRGLDHLRVRGLMGLASMEGDLEVVRPQFVMLRELRDTYQPLNEGSLQLEELSMGMSHDLEVAIEEGATMVRVGSAIFGNRN